MRFFAALLALFVFMSGAAEAKLWRIDYPNSNLTFTGDQSGKPFTGKFSTFYAKVDFDPEHPEAAKIDVNIDMTSAKTGDVQRDKALPQPEWFDSATYLQATFTATSVKKIDAAHFSATGPLTIKTYTHEVTLNFELKPDRDGQRAAGTLDIDRTQYGVGTGEWMSEEMVAHKVTIGVDLMAY